jgi:hypothetical protein
LGEKSSTLNFPIGKICRTCRTGRLHPKDAETPRSIELLVDPNQRRTYSDPGFNPVKFTVQG